MGSPSHDTMVGQADAGCLVICDVTGYTAYLQSVELEHAQDVLADLTETVVERLQPVFRLSKLVGDAAFAYGLESEVAAARLFDTIEATYFAFRERVRDIDHATSCDCAACELIPQLDLKVVTHFGRFTRQHIAGNEELTGPDVILAHRLLKNTVRDRLDVNGYALHTDACIGALGVDPESLGFVEHRESYEDVGEVDCWIDDLGERWRHESERRRVYIVPADAEFEITVELPAPAPIVWEWTSSPEKRALWESADRIDEEAAGGRRGVGTTNHCVHGKNTFIQRILDWRPFRYFTIATDVPGIGPWPLTVELEPVDGGTTRVHYRAERVEGIKARLAWAMMRRQMYKTFEQEHARLQAFLAEDQVPAGT
jgi:uncharacterized protein YndB with AHSA1/START domain